MKRTVSVFVEMGDDGILTAVIRCDKDTLGREPVAVSLLASVAHVMASAFSDEAQESALRDFSQVKVQVDLSDVKTLQVDRDVVLRMMYRDLGERLAAESAAVQVAFGIKPNALELGVNMTHPEKTF